MRNIAILLFAGWIVFGCQTVAEKPQANQDSNATDWLQTALDTQSPVVSSASIDWIVNHGSHAQLQQLYATELQSLQTGAETRAGGYLPALTEKWQLLDADITSPDQAHLYYRVQSDDFYWVRMDLLPDSDHHWRIVDMQNFDDGLSYRDWLKQVHQIDVALSATAKGRSKSELDFTAVAILAQGHSDSLKKMGIDPDLPVLLDLRSKDFTHPLTAPAQDFYRQQIEANPAKILPLQGFMRSLASDDAQLLAQSQLLFSSMTRDDWWPLFFRGKLKETTGDQQSAQQLLTEAITVEPIVASSYFSLLRSYVADQAYPQAVVVMNYLDDHNYRLDKTYFSDPLFEDFIKSPEYIQWLARDKS